MELVVKENVPLAPYTTLHIGGSAALFAEVTDRAQLSTVYSLAVSSTTPVVVLGEGSNVLVSDAGYRGLVVRMRIGGIESVEKEGSVFVTAGAGELLDDVVAYTVERGFWGIENLSHIPGTVGATPVQNVGAYGVEVADMLHSVEVFDMDKGELAVLSVPACGFGYRDSIFKTSEGKKYIITAVTFKLSLVANPQTTYKDLALTFPDGSLPTLADIRKEIIAIRSEKFPDWNTVGTAGSFFKNPIVSPQKAGELSLVYPALPLYPTEAGGVKISLGFVLDKILARKGYTEGKVGLFEKQALVLIAQRGAAYSEVKSFAEKIIAQVKEKIGVTVEMEVTEIL